MANILPDYLSKHMTEKVKEGKSLFTSFIVNVFYACRRESI